MAKACEYCGKPLPLTARITGKKKHPECEVEQQNYIQTYKSLLFQRSVEDGIDEDFSEMVFNVVEKGKFTSEMSKEINLDIYKQIKENLLSDRILSEFDRSYLTDLQNFLGLTDIEAEADLLDEILKTTYSLERFHDDVIGAITIDWLDGKIYISIIGWKKRWEVELLNFRNVSIPRQLPWGSSKYINSSKNQKNTNNLWELEIELQSGDVFKFEAEQVRLNQRKEELSDLEWLVGDRIASVQFESESNPWVINFASGATLQIESMWRLVELGALCSTSLDHGHRFGLAKDFDSVAALRGMGQYPIKSVTVRPMTGDLFLQLGSMFVLEVLSTSAGYEHWQITHPVLGLLVASGGELHVFPK